MMVRVAMLRMSVYFTDTGMEFLGVGCDGIIQQMHICFSPLCAANLWDGVLCLGPLGVLCLGLFGGVLCLGLLGGVLCLGPWACANAERTRRIRPSKDAALKHKCCIKGCFSYFCRGQLEAN